MTEYRNCQRVIQKPPARRQDRDDTGGGGGGGTSPYIAGISVIASPGQLSSAITVTLTGISTTASQGTVTAAQGRVVTLTGLAATTARGTPTPQVTVAPTGMALTTSRGSVTTSGGSVGNVETTFDALYNPAFRLDESTGVRTISVPSNPSKTANLSTPGYTDANHGTMVWRMTNRTTEATAGGVEHLRHEYSKRQCWNCDNTRYIAQDASGFWFVFDASTFAKLTRSGTSGSMPGFAGDCEPYWHPTNPAKLWHTGNSGSLVWTEYDVNADTQTTLFDLTGKLPAGFTTGTRSWMKGEGRPSNDGRYFALMIETAGFSHLGTIMYDRIGDTVVGWVQTTSRPDHVMTGPSGNHFLLWYQDVTIGVRAFNRTYQGSVLTDGTKVTNIYGEHGDVGIDEDGDDCYVQADYTTGYMIVCKLIGGSPVNINIAHLYPAGGEGTAMHVCGIASARHHGWFLMEFEISYANYGSTHPSPTIYRIYDRVVLVQVKAAGRMLNVAEHWSSGNMDGAHYFNEPQATINLDGTRIAFASAWNGRNGPETGGEDSYMIGLPSWAIQ